MSIARKFLPNFLTETEGPPEDLTPYRRLWRHAVLVVSLVSLAPLVTMTIINYRQSQKAIHTEMLQPVARLTSNAKRSLESFLAARQAALTLLIQDKSFQDLIDEAALSKTFLNLKTSFSGFIDLGLIDSEGNQRSYVGPYELQGKNYENQDWFHEVRFRGIHVSDVFKGYRNFPHFVIAVRHELGHDDFYVLRATIDTDILNQHTRSLQLRSTSDAFIINHKGILQTTSRFHGDLLKQCSLAVPPFSTTVDLMEQRDSDGHLLTVGYAYIDRSPFVLMVTENKTDLMTNWLSLRQRLIWFLGVTFVVVLLVILWGATHMVTRIRESDHQRSKILHKVQYTSKMATIGRLAAGVAHEINNPLAIINEKAGLLKDLASVSDDFPQKEKLLKSVDSILNSVERCSTITHRLLGFARRMDVKMVALDLGVLLREVLTFLEKEATYRNLVVNVDIPVEIPTIESDRGQLQQVFLNIINNAFDAVADHGRIGIRVAQRDEESVAVTISDNGKGMDKQQLKRIFDPFFTTKKEYGTGLGLSITYGLVQKLGGKIDVQSKVGVGTTFTVVLPIRAGQEL